MLMAGTGPGLPGSVGGACRLAVRRQAEARQGEAVAIASRARRPAPSRSACPAGCLPAAPGRVLPVEDQFASAPPANSLISSGLRHFAGAGLPGDVAGRVGRLPGRKPAKSSCPPVAMLCAAVSPRHGRRQRWSGLG